MDLVLINELYVLIMQLISYMMELDIHHAQVQHLTGIITIIYLIKLSIQVKDARITVEQAIL